MTHELLNCELALESAVRDITGPECPPLLAQALHYAVFPGGARVRPRLCLAVSLANGADDPALASAGACAIELLHCASLVHDDLPCFDDATERRGKPTVHAAFGERIAVLAGDALIVGAFQHLNRQAAHALNPDRNAAVTGMVARGVASPSGICAGQAWECESRVDVSRYHQSKTGALFVAATCSGAAAAGVDPEPWRALGATIGEAYQVADDIHDATAEDGALGKPTGIDIALDRPSAVKELGLEGAVKRLEQCVQDGLDSIPDCAGKDLLIAIVKKQSERFFPAGTGRTAA